MRGLRPGVVLFGDSLTEQNYTAPNLLDRGYFNWANYALGSPLDVLKYAGVSGNTTAQMLARINADVIAERPQWVIVLGGINDINGLATADTITANLGAIYARCRAAGARVIACTIPPFGGLNTAPKKAVWDAVNAYITASADAQTIFVSDFASAYPGADQYTPAANATYDTTHPTGYGAQLLGAVLAQTLQPFNLPPYPFGQNHALANPTMTGTGGTKQGVTTGSVANNWLLNASGVCAASKAARVDGVLGEWQSIALSGTNASANLYQAVSSGFVIGRSVQLCVEVQIDDWTGPVLSMSCHLTAYSPGSSATWHGTHNDASIYLTANPGPGVMRTKPFVIPENTNSLQAFVTLSMPASVSGQATIRVGRVELRKV